MVSCPLLNWIERQTPTLKAVGSTPVGQTTYYSRLRAFAGGYFLSAYNICTTICCILRFGCYHFNSLSSAIYPPNAVSDNCNIVSCRLLVEISEQA